MFGALCREQIFRENGNIGPSFTQRRNMDFDGIQAMKEVESK